MSPARLVYVLWDPADRPRAVLRRVLLAECAPLLAQGGARGLQLDIADELAEVRSPAPGPPFERRMVALLKLWVDQLDDRFAHEDVLRRAGFLIAGYLVDEQIYTDYGGNRHSAARDWPDGQRSPGVVAVTLMERPRRLDHAEWIRRWHGRQSPMSEAMQPRCRYVRNVVERPLTPGAPAFEGIVEEAWPSFRHVTNPFLFYGASNVFALLRNMLTMLRSVTAFLTLWRIRTVMTSEYFLDSRAPGGPAPGPESA